MTKKIITAIIIIAVIVGIVFALKRGANDSDSQSAANPDAVVARVNDEEITRGELDKRIAQIEQSSQIQIPEEDVAARAEQERLALDEMIGGRVFLLAARGKGFTAADTEVQSELGRLISQFENPEAFQLQLSAVGITEARLREDLAKQLTVNKYYRQLVTENDVTITDEEIKAVYDTEVAPQEGAPTLEEISPQIKAQLEQQEMQGIIAQIITELRETMNIEVLL